MSVLGLRLVPDELWEPLVPRYPQRRQSGETAPLKDRAVFTAIVHVPTSGCAWRHLPTEFEVSSSTAHRQFTLWPRLHQAVLDEPRPARPGRLEQRDRGRRLGPGERGVR